METIALLTDSEEKELRQIRRRIHEHPELSHEEYRTTELICAQLKKLEHVEILDYGLKTGLIAKLTGKMPGRTVALRADIDAIRCEEKAETDVRSQEAGLMHACGHDHHTAYLLGAAMILNRNWERLSGSVIFIFQPAEETTDGAQEILNTGVFDEQGIAAVFGLHNRPEVPCGQVVVQTAPLMAAKDNFVIDIRGLGGHGSMPDLCVDPIVCAASMIQTLQTLVSRNTNPLKSAVLSIGSVHGGSIENLIVDEVQMTGSLRTLQEDVRTRLLGRLETVVQETAKTYECTASLAYRERLPLLAGDSTLYDTAVKAAAMAMGEQAVVTSAPCLATEDFSLYTKKVPGFFYWLGSGIPGKECHAWHSARFCANEDALRHGAELLACTAYTAALDSPME